MVLFRRLKNLWLLSAYRPSGLVGDTIVPFVKIKKDFSTVEKKLATIVGLEKPDYFKQENGEIA